jgi:hypothetical protein
MVRNQELEEVVPNDSDPLLGRENRESESSVELSPPQPASVSPPEIEDEETDGSSAACCRICLEAESEIGDGPNELPQCIFVMPVSSLYVNSGMLLSGVNLLCGCSKMKMKNTHDILLTLSIGLTKFSALHLLCD